MVVLSHPLPDLASELLTLFSTTDPSLADAPFIVFHGPSTTTNSTLSSARIQAHIHGPSGFHSYPRITIAPNAPLYAAVRHLPLDQQGDDVCRGLALALFKYFLEMPESIKDALKDRSSSQHGSHAGPTFDEAHAGRLAGRLTRVAHEQDIITGMQSALSPRITSSAHLHVVLPENSMRLTRAELVNHPDEDLTTLRYGKYAPLIGIFGEPTFIPTAKLRRAPSRPKVYNRSKLLSASQMEALRREMADLVATEDRYVQKMQELVNHASQDFGRHETSLTPNRPNLATLFPPSLDEILKTNTAFQREIRTVIEEPDIRAQQDLRTAPLVRRVNKDETKQNDPTGAVRLAQVLVDWFPKFERCYVDYMRASGNFAPILSRLLEDTQSDFSRVVANIGEQQLRSMLIEPVQRLPRYTLFIDSLATQLPMSHPALSLLMQARDVISGICSLECQNADDSSAARRLRELTAGWPSSLNPKGRLVATTDFIELKPPYRLDVAPTESDHIMFLFCDCIVFTKRTQQSSINSRDILAQLDHSRVPIAAATGGALEPRNGNPLPLMLVDCVSLDSVHFSETKDDRVVIMSSFAAGDLARGRTLRENNIERHFLLSGVSVGKAASWSREVAKARIEACFSEDERNANAFEMRSGSLSGGSFEHIAAICERRGDSTFCTSRAVSCIEISIDGATVQAANSQRPIDSITIAIATAKDNKCDVSIWAEAQPDSTESVEIEALGRFLGRACELNIITAGFNANLSVVSRLIASQHQSRNLRTITPFIETNVSVLRSLMAMDQPQVQESQSLRSRSPRKLFSTFLGGGSMRNTTSPSKSRAVLQYHIPNLASADPQTGSSHNDALSTTLSASYPQTGSSPSKVMPDSLEKLDETFACYVLAITKWKHNLEGRDLRLRKEADELAVNEIYNCMSKVFLQLVATILAN